MSQSQPHFIYSIPLVFNSWSGTGHFQWEFTMPLFEVCLWLLTPSQGPHILFQISPISESSLVSLSTTPPLQAYTHYLKSVILHSKPNAKPSLCGYIPTSGESKHTLKVSISSSCLWVPHRFIILTDYYILPTRFPTGSWNSI